MTVETLNSSLLTLFTLSYKQITKYIALFVKVWITSAVQLP
jgi:hypothetical protein